MNVRILARVVVYDAVAKKVLLVRNKGANYWYCPGGGWEHEHETILECAVREVHEEVGLAVKVKRLLWMQEFHATEDTIFFETFWLASPTSDAALNTNHVDLDPNGQVEEARWYAQEELVELKAFPKRLKNSFWDGVEAVLASEDAFIGVS